MMNSSPMQTGVQCLRRLAAASGRPDESDEQLLHAFGTRRDDSAFAALVRRHGPMVFHVCRRVLEHQQDAEDAFQATFLVLARNTASLRNKSSLSSFLHGTAYRTAMKAKRSAARRGKREGSLGALAQPRSPINPAEELSWREVRTFLNEEIARLPEKYRTAFVLCCVENLSQAEAARRLGLKERTLSSQLAAARKRLQQALTRRGVELTAVLAAIALVTQPASALPAGLMATTLKAAMAGAAGEGLSEVVSAPVAELAKGAAASMVLSKVKIAVAVLLLVATSGLLVGLYRQASGPLAATTEPPAAKAEGKPKVAPPQRDAATNAVYAGCVVGPDGQPVARAKLYLLYYTPKELPIPVRATSDKNGRFRFTAARNEFDQSLSVRPWDEAIVVAMAKGYGIGLPELPSEKPKLPIDWKVRVTQDDVPITGRIIDLQGKLIAGVSVRIHELYRPRKNDLTAWLGDLKEKKEGYPTLGTHLIETGGLWMGRDLGKVFPAVVTGADGRFVLRGVGRERVVALRFYAPTIAADELFVMTRPGDTIRVASWQRGRGDEMTFCGSTFEHIAVPGQPIVGVVRDKDTRKPLTGAIVRSDSFAVGPRMSVGGKTHLRAIADKEGRYRLDGMPRSEGNEIRAEGPDGQPYLMSVVKVPKGFALEPVTVDFQLKRGVWINVKVTEKATGKPVQCLISCAIHAENPFRKEARGLMFDHDLFTRGDGTVRFAGLPGRSVVTAQTGDPRYLKRVGADRIKDLQRFNLFQPFNAVVEIKPAKDAKEVRCAIALEIGRNLRGKVLDPEGRPLSGVKFAGLGHPGQWEGEALRTEAFTLLSLHPDETRLLQFSHAKKHLAGSLAVRGDAKGPLTVTLKRAGTLTGRFITPDGKPLGDLEYHASLYGLIAEPPMVLKADPAFGTFPRGLRTGKDGSFRVKNLAPGLKYRFVLDKGMYALIPDGPAGTGVTVKEGETKDLGDVTVKLIE